MKVKIFLLPFFYNGELYHLQTYQLFTLKDLINFFHYKENLIVLEYNGKITNQKKWSFLNLKNQDKVELLTIVGGG